MTDQYKELPECKSADEFKVGELVKIYMGNCVGTEIVHSIEGDTLFLFIGRSEESERKWCVYGDKMAAHFKQCRKLKKKEPRVFWIHENSIPWNEDRIPIVCLKKPETDIYGNYIKVQEVLQ